MENRSALTRTRMEAKHRVNRHLVVSVTVLRGVQFVTDERSTADHLADGEDAVSLDSVDANLFPIALCEQLGPEGSVGGLGPDLTVCRDNGIDRSGRGECFGDVDLFGDRPCDREVVLEGFRVAWSKKRGTREGEGLEGWSRNVSICCSVVGGGGRSCS